jgi:hypothetical protein
MTAGVTEDVATTQTLVFLADRPPGQPEGGTGGLDAQQRCKIRRAVRELAEAPVDTIRRVIDQQAQHYGVSVEVIARSLTKMR